MKYLEQDPGKRAAMWVADVESTGLISLDRTRWPEKIWCIVCLNIETQEEVIFHVGEDNVFPNADFRSWYSRVKPVWVGHNFLSYDAPLLNHLLDTGISWVDCVDTLVLSQLYDPQMPAPEPLGPLQKHSLEAWGIRLRQLKQPHNEWDRFSEEMLQRCRSDAALNRSVYLALSKRMSAKGFSEKSCYIEHGAHVIIDEQMAGGISFDIPKAEELYTCLRTEQHRLTDKIRKTFKPELVKIGEYKYKERADGKPYASFIRHQALGLELRWNSDQTQYSLWKPEEFNIASPPQRLKRLLELGYIPQKKTKKGNPSVDEESLVEFAKICGIAEVQDIADWLVLFGRANAVETWLGLVNRETGRLHGRVWSCGAANRRMTHTTPNTANIPKVKTKYGKECRSLFRASEGLVLVGVDAKSLQMRVFGHYLGGGDIAKMYIEGDPHQFNSDLLSDNSWGYFADRETGAKNGFYAFIFGAQDKKLGMTFDTRIVDPRKATEYGKWGREQLMKNTPGLERLTKEVQYEFKNKNGFIATVDGGFVRCPSEHSAVNYKIASGEACLMKLVDIRTKEAFDKAGFEYRKVIDCHDEDQYECQPDIAESLGKLACQVITECGEELGFLVKMEGNYKVGPNWSATH